MQDKNASPTFYLIDGSGYIFRAYFSMLQNREVAKLSTKEGVPTHAIYVFNQMLLKLMRDLKHSNRLHTEGTHLAILFDSKEPTFRERLYPEYKSHRPAPPADLIAQIPMIHELVASWDIPVSCCPGYEADDLIGTLAKQAETKNYAVKVISGDKDLMQLVSEHTVVYDPMREALFDRNGVKNKLGVFPEQVTDYLALLGDASDNIPGVPKIGQKTATELLVQFGSLDAIYQHLEDITKPSLRETLRQNRDLAYLSKKLATLHFEAPVEFIPDRFAWHGLDPNKISSFFSRLQFSEKTKEQTLTLSKSNTLPLPNATPPAPIHTMVSRDAYRTVLTEEDLHTLIQAIEKVEYLALDTETTSLQAMQAELVGMSIATSPGESYYIPLRHHYLGVPEQLAIERVRAQLEPVLAKKKIVGQNIKYDWHVLTQAGFQLPTITDDTLLLSYLIHPEDASHSLDALAKKYLHHENITYSSLFGNKKTKQTFQDIPIDTATSYAAEDADVTLRLMEFFKPQLEEKLASFYHSVEIPVLSILCRMEHTGIKIDVPKLKSLGAEIHQQLQLIEKEIYELLGEEPNLNSPKQLGVILFEKLQLPISKRTKSGPSTDQSVLEELAPLHPVAKKMLEYRQLQKLSSTYVDSLPLLIHPKTGRIHTSYHQAMVATGRLSSSDPNLQNIPIKTALGKKIRSTFITEPGWKIISADYSQIELRILAHLSEDEGLRKAFLENKDIHNQTAMRLFHVEESAVNKDMRRRAKTLNFGLLYGLSAFRLAKEENMSMAEAKSFIDHYFAAYPKIKTYMNQVVEEARKKGYVETLLGRKRPIENLFSTNRTLKQAAERVTVNTPIQGGAADLIKLAMIKVQEKLDQARLSSRLLLQVHDELVLEAKEEEVESTVSILKQEMETAYPLQVPLQVDIHVADSWEKD